MVEPIPSAASRSPPTEPAIPRTPQRFEGQGTLTDRTDASSSVVRDRAGGSASDRGDSAGDPRNRVGLLTVLLTGQFMANMDSAISNVATPSIRRDLGASDGQLELVIAGYVLAYAMLLVAGARLGEAR